MTLQIAQPQFYPWEKRMAALTEFDMLGKKVAGMHAKPLLQAQNVIRVKQQMNIGTADEKTGYFRMAVKIETVFGVNRLPLAWAGFVHVCIVSTIARR